MFATADWLSAFPNHVLKPLSSDCSDHCPLLLHHHVYNGAKRRFKFEPYWIKLPGYMEVVAAAWASTPIGADPFRILDHKLRNVAKALCSWSNSKLSNIRMQLVMAREVILCLDGEQERRPLHSWEFNLHCALKRQVLGLASLSRTIARQRSRILFLAEGDANTKFYHLQACHRNRHNHIDSIISDGSQLINDREMEDALYNHYNTILGVNFERTRRIAFEAIGLPSVDLDALEVLFTEDEVWPTIRELPNDKAPGPDGFTAAFYKSTWDIIKTDIMHAINAFWSLDFRSFHHLNGAYMVLLKKRPNPSGIGDYRPISLIHSFSKIITKCLARRVAVVADHLVLQNQSAFIKGRSIHDNFRNVQLTCKAMHVKKAACVMLKVDIAKAFDTVAWSFLLEILQHMGFGQRWRNWISTILSTASTRILLNGHPGRRICHARGLRQGDPLSPLLFVFVMEVLNRLLVWVETRGHLSPISGIAASRVSLYADDLLLFIKPTENDLRVVMATLNIFGLASGLFSNLQKSVATPIHCSDQEILRIQDILACAIQDFPCRYLGIPLSVRKLKRADEQPLLDKVAARIPGWKGNLLNTAGRSALVQATLSAIPIHASIALCLSPWAIGCIDKLRRGFIWAGSDSVAGGRCKVAWTIVCRPKELGGLGIADLTRAGVALRTRWLWKERVAGIATNTKDTAALALFQAATVFTVGNGRSTLF